MAIPTQEQIERFKTAVQTRDADGLRSLFQSAPEVASVVNEPLFGFDSPAILCVKNDRDMVDLLLSHGADINARSHWWAGSFGVLDQTDPEVAAYLIERGALVDVHAAAGLGMVDRLRELLDADPGLVNAKGGDGMRPLHFARSREVMDLLLERGADLNAKDVDHHGTPAQWAARDLDKLNYLAEHGAEIDLFGACVLGDVERVKSILDADPDALNARIGEGPYTAPGGHAYDYTLGMTARPLMLAAEYGHDELVDFLLERSAPSQKLLLACRRGDDAAVDALLFEHPGLVNSLSQDEKSFLADAAWDHNVPAVRTMLRAGFDVNTHSDRASTPLDRAAIHGYLDLVELLLEHGASLEITNPYGGAPLRACLWGSIHFRDKDGDYPACVERLIAAGSKLPDEAWGSDEVIEVLERHGVKIPARPAAA